MWQLSHERAYDQASSLSPGSLAKFGGSSAASPITCLPLCHRLHNDFESLSLLVTKRLPRHQASSLHRTTLKARKGGLDRVLFALQPLGRKPNIFSEPSPSPWYNQRVGFRSCLLANQNNIPRPFRAAREAEQAGLGAYPVIRSYTLFTLMGQGAEEAWGTYGLSTDSAGSLC